jgi:hypothetical protein
MELKAKPAFDSSYKLFVTLFAVFTVSNVSVAQDQSIPGLAIKDARICEDVQDRIPVKTLENPEHRVIQRPVWVWLLLTGTNETLSHLKPGAELPLKTV